MKITIPAFENYSRIPKQYTGDGKNISPRILISDVPAEAKSLALIVDDPDSPKGLFVHWVVWNLPVGIQEIPEGHHSAFQGTNSYNELNWRGPNPPPGKLHRYFFKLYALDSFLNLPPGSTKAELESAMEGHIVAKSEWVGVYGR